MAQVTLGKRHHSHAFTVPLTFGRLHSNFASLEVDIAPAERQNFRGTTKPAIPAQGQDQDPVHTRGFLDQLVDNLSLDKNCRAGLLCVPALISAKGLLSISCRRFAALKSCRDCLIILAIVAWA